MSCASLALLPSELLINILIRLSLPDLLSASCANRSIYRVIKDSVELQYSLALQTYGMVDGGKSDPLTDKLKELLLMEDSWRTLDLSNRVSVKVQHNASHVYELSNGVYILGESVFSGDARETESIRFFDLSGCKTGSKVCEDVWPRITIPDRIIDIGISLHEHDLLCMICLRKTNNDEDDVILHFKQLSTGHSHPLAKCPEINIGSSRLLSGRKPSVMIGISGPHLMLCLAWRLPSLTRRSDSLLLIDWIIGDIILREDVPNRTYGGFAFVAHNLVLLTNLSTKTLEIIQLPDPTKTGGSYGTVFRRVARLHLPKTNDHSTILRMTCRTDPILFGASHQTFDDVRGLTSCRGHSKRAFSADPSLAVMLVRLLVRIDSERETHTLNLIISRTALVDVVHSYCNSTKSPGADATIGIQEAMPVEIPWSHWSPGIVRWCTGPETQSIWITTIAGQRFAGMHSSGDLVIKDFNQYAVKRMRMDLKNNENVEGKELLLSDQARGRVIESHARSLDDEGNLNRVFAEVVPRNELPYAETTSFLDNECDGVFIDEERVIVLHRSLRTWAIDKFTVLSM